ncbi:MAG: hydroxysqualene dehydroxylase HpnE [Methylotenera sp.]
MNKPHVAIIGGGCAGLTAAIKLLDSDYQVTVFEASPHLGGRARTVLVENNSLMHLLDNGQHILLGAYHETLALLRKVGVDEKLAFLRVPLKINMHANSGKPEFLLKSEHLLPAPLNLLFGLFACEGLSFSERIAAIKFIAQLKMHGYQINADTPLEPFLIAKQQSTKLIEMLWEPLCLAALNTPIAVASTRIFLNVLRDSFTGHKKNSDFLIPKLDLSKILSNPLAQYIQAKGGEILLNSRVSQLNMESNGQYSIGTKAGKSTFSHVIIATPPSSLDKLLPAFPKLQNTLVLTETFGYQPIYTIYLQYPADTKLPNVMTGLTKNIGQWVFDRGQLCAQKGLISVIVSASGRHQQLSQEELALKIANELNLIFPDLPKPLWNKVIAEKRATFSCVPNLPRPSNKTAQPNLFLAGDYTYADYPSTIEGAVRSGIACANLICNA